MEWRYIGLVFFFLLETLTAQEGYNYPTPTRPLSGGPERPGGPDKQPGQGITSSPNRDFSLGISGQGQDYSGPQGQNGYSGRGRPSGQGFSPRPQGPGKTYLAPESATDGYPNDSYEKQSTGRKNGYTRVPGNQGYPNERNYPSQQQGFSNQRETTQGYPSQNQQGNKQNYPGSSVSDQRYPSTSDNPQSYPNVGSTKNYPSRPGGAQSYSEGNPGQRTDSPQEGFHGYPKQQGSTEGYPGSQNYPGQQTDSPQEGSRGYPKQQGSTHGYRKQQGGNEGYPGSQNYPGQQTDSPQEGSRGYPKQQGTTQGYRKQQGGNEGYPGSLNYPGQQTDSPQEGSRGYPKQEGTTQGYRKQQGGNEGYPGSKNYPGQQIDSPQEGSRGYPKQQGTTQGYPGQQRGSSRGYPSEQRANEGLPGQQTSSQNYPGEVTGDQGYSGQRGEPSRYNGQQRGPQGLQGGNNIYGQGEAPGQFQESGDFPVQQESSQSDEGDYSAIPGEPDKDYPIFSEIPQTSFSCDQQQYPGYYADVEARCQVFHICANNETYDFLCPNGTIFHQEYLVCVWWNQFDCDTAPSLYELNANIYDYSTNGGQGFPPVSGGAGYPKDNNQGSQTFETQRPGGYPNQAQDQGYSSQLPSGYPSERPLNSKPGPQSANAAPSSFQQEYNNQGSQTFDTQKPGGYPNQAQDQGYSSQLPNGYPSERPLNSKPGPQRANAAPSSFQQEYPSGGPKSSTGYPSGRPQGGGYSNAERQNTNGRHSFTPRPNQEPISTGTNGYSSLEPGFPSTTTTETASQDGGNGYSNGRPGTSIPGIRPQAPTRGYLPPFQ